MKLTRYLSCHQRTLLDIAVKYGLAPVSYTHLDVYKRQGYYSTADFICKEEFL